MFKIIKKGTNNFWHWYNGDVKKVYVSKITYVLDDVANTFQLVQANGSNIPANRLLVTDIIVIDETDASVEETFTTAEELRDKLTELGYGVTSSGGGAVDSVNGQSGVVVLDADDIAETSIRKWLTSTLKTAYDGAVSWITTNGTNILNHLASTSNPHSTTASQVGAYTTSQVDTLLSSKIGQAVLRNISNTSTIVGWSSFTFKIIKEYDFGNGFVYVEYFLDGTSNSSTTSFTLTDNNTSHQIKEINVSVRNNGTASNTNGCYVIGSNSNVVNFYQNNNETVFTGANQKIVRGSFMYYKL